MAILRAARTCLMTKPLDELTLTAIGEVAKMSQPNVGRYFKSKREIVEALIGIEDQQFSSLLAEVDGDELFAWLESFFETFLALDESTPVLSPGSRRFNQSLAAHIAYDPELGRIYDQSRKQRVEVISSRLRRAGARSMLRDESFSRSFADVYASRTIRRLRRRDATHRSRRSPTDTGEKGRKTFLLRGLVWCGTCEKRWTAQDAKGGRFRYYRCMPAAPADACREPYVPCGRLESDVRAHLGALRLDSSYAADLRTVADEVIAEQRQQRLARLGRIEKEEQALTLKRQRLLDALALGQLDVDDVQEALGRNTHERDKLRARKARLDDGLEARANALKRMLALDGCVAELYDAAESDDAKKRLLRRVFSRIEVQDRELTRLVAQPPFTLLLPDDRATGSAGLRTRLAEFLRGSDDEVASSS